MAAGSSDLRSSLRKEETASGEGRYTRGPGLRILSMQRRDLGKAEEMLWPELGVEMEVNDSRKKMVSLQSIWSGQRDSGTQHR